MFRSVSREARHEIRADTSYIVVMPSDAETKRRQSIAYILRRRKRGRKTGANSGAPVKSWAEYSEVSFTPTGSYLRWGRWLIFVGALFAMALPVVFLSMLAQPADHHRETLAFESVQLHPIGWVLVALIGLLSVTLAVFAIAFIVLAIRRVLRANWPYKKE